MGERDVVCGDKELRVRLHMFSARCSARAARELKVPIVIPALKDTSWTYMASHCAVGQNWSDSEPCGNFRPCIFIVVTSFTFVGHHHKNHDRITTTTITTTTT